MCMMQEQECTPSTAAIEILGRSLASILHYDSHTEIGECPIADHEIVMAACVSSALQDTLLRAGCVPAGC